MTVKFTSHDYRDTHSVYVRVEGADPIKRRTGKRKLVPQHAQWCKYLRGAESDWEVVEVHVSGVLAKNDGTPGTSIASERFFAHNRHEWPDWLVILVDESTPETLASVAREPLVSAG
jgi:hypothetical protein